MSRSSSGSWSGVAPPQGDIIDLDRFMRTARPSPPRDAHRGLVVASGRRPRSPRKHASSSSSAEQPAPARAPTQRDKRFSHDSGLSDGSYASRRHRPHRRVACVENRPRRKTDLQPKGSADSLRAFRTVCERALLDQQQQIARVAQLCERLTERRPTTDTSEISSSSQSTSDQIRKDKHRTEECKTYKIIMTKLDELNRLFAARARSPPQRPPRPDTQSGSVSVSDKVVATEPPPGTPRNTMTSTLLPPRPDTQSGSVSVSEEVVATEPPPGTPRNRMTSTLVTTKRADAMWNQRPSVSRMAEKNNCDRAEERSRRLMAMRAVSAGPALDIAPANNTRDCPNVLTESVVKCDSSEESSCSGLVSPCDFDLDNPVHLYAQAKRLQAMHATTYRRARSVEDSRSSNLCSICRGYFRSLRQYLATQLLCCPTDCVC